ncbi:hypothetical protein [Robertmurraya sp. Marseille-Q9965]
MIIELVSFVSPIKSTSLHDREIILNNETVEVVSSIAPIVSSVIVPKRATIEVSSFISNVVGFALFEMPYKNETRTVGSFVGGFNSNITIITDKKPMLYLATCWYEENTSNIYCIKNPSYCEVIE